MAVSAVSAAIRARAALTGVSWLTLMVIAGCNKATEHRRTTARAPDSPAVRTDVLDPDTRPRMLFEVFGDRSDPRMVPVAVLDGHVIRRFDLSPGDWLLFDRRYDRVGAQYTLYQDGDSVGTATVTRGMWQYARRPLVTLPHCRHLMPLAAVAVDQHVPDGITTELLAANTSLRTAPHPSDLQSLVAIGVARRLATGVAKAAHIPLARLDSLDFHAVAVRTGATSEPTLIGSFVDPASGGATTPGTTTTYVFVIADKTGVGYAPTYQLIVNGPPVGAVYQRYIDHLDLDGDGVDDIVLETWTYGGDSYITVMKWVNGRWKETFRGARSWCLDPSKS